jgi:hypothetical protein
VARSQEERISEHHSASTGSADRLRLTSRDRALLAAVSRQERPLPRRLLGTKQVTFDPPRAAPLIEATPVSEVEPVPSDLESSGT